MRAEVLLHLCRGQRRFHTQTQMRLENGAVVDADLAPLLMHLEERGVEVAASCQGLNNGRSFRRHDGYLAFTTYEAAADCLQQLLPLRWSHLAISSGEWSGTPIYLVEFPPLWKESRVYELRRSLWELGRPDDSP